MATKKESNNQFVIFLALNDGEAAAIREVCEQTHTECVAKRIGWGASVSHFREEIDAALKVGKTPVLVELAGAETIDGAMVIDHHGDYVDRPASLLQVLDLLGLEPTRWQQLVAANDAGYFAAMEALGATTKEMQTVRKYDRDFQLVEQPYGSGNWVEKFSPAIEAAAEEAIAAMEVKNGVQIVRFKFDACAAITDRLWLSNAPQKLLILCENGESDFFGDWALCQALRGKETGAKTPEGYDIFSHFGGWTGGKAIQAGYECGFWGNSCADQQAVEEFILDWFNKVQFVNCTPHAIVLNNGTRFEPSGTVARVSQTTSLFSGHGVATQEFGEVEGLPEPKDGVVYIVSAMVLGALKGTRPDCVAPATGHPLCVRDAEKRIVSVPGFLR